MQFIRWQWRIQRLQAFWENAKRFLPVFFFFGGVIWDQLTLTRIDSLGTNLLLFIYLLLLGALIVISNMAGRDLLKWEWVNQNLKWLPLLIQFCMGSLFSAYVVFYFQSASFSSTAFFFLVLVLLLVGNEFLKSRIGNVYLQLGLYFLVSVSFFIFFVPIVLRRVDYFSFTMGGISALLLLAVLIWFFYRVGVFERRRELLASICLVLLLFSGLQWAYVQHWIPPVPLSLKYGGLFHDISREGDGYHLQYAKPPWYAPWRDSDQVFYYKPGVKVLCFTSVFAPTKLKDAIYHIWQYYSYETGKWETTDRMHYAIEGGREQGYRGFSFKQNLAYGRWRVEIRSQEDRLLGRVYFKVFGAEVKEPELITRQY